MSDSPFILFQDTLMLLHKEKTLMLQISLPPQVLFILSILCGALLI